MQERGDELDVWLLPPLAYTKSNEHAWSAGTVWLSATTLLAVLDDIGRCVATTPAQAAGVPQRSRRQLVAAQRRQPRAAPEARADDVPRPSRRAARPGRQPSPADELGMGVHGGTDETSMMLHLRPELVDMALAVRNVPERARREPVRALRRPGQLRVAVERLRPERPHRRPDGGHRRAGQGAVRGAPSRRSARRWPRSPRSTSRR